MTISRWGRQKSCKDFARQQGKEFAQPLATGHRQCSQGLAVQRIFGVDEAGALAFEIAGRQFERPFHRLGARVAEKEAVQGAGGEQAQVVGQTGGIGREQFLG